jgi:membrane protease YdiL (CAAX protease family)
MPIDSSYLPPGSSPEDVAARRERFPVTTLDSAPLSVATPTLLHTILFLLVVFSAFLALGGVFSMSIKSIAPHLHESLDQMKNDPRLIIPLEGLGYLVAAGASALLFPLLWNRSFLQGVHWRAAVMQRRWWVLVTIGVATSAVVQVLSNFLPIPKELPIDKLFTRSFGVWLIAIFGVTVAPAFEELAFRGFLLPSLATAWDWVAQRASRGRRLRAGNPGQVTAAEWEQQAAVYSSLPPQGAAVFHRHSRPDSEGQSSAHSDPAWSIPALIFATVITSIGFAMLHGAQLAHSFAPLAVLFVVSVVLCVTRLRFHSLAASTVVHSIYNATIFTMLFIGTDGFRHLDKLSR